MSARCRRIGLLILLTTLGLHDTAAYKGLAQKAQAQTKPVAPTSSSHSPLMRFARSVPRPAAPQGAATRNLTISPVRLQSVDQRQILIEGLIARTRIVDTARFERAFGQGETTWDSARQRIQVGLADELRRSIGRRTLPELATFDPFAIVQADTQLERMLSRTGLAIDDIDGDAMGYRTLVAR